MRNLRLNKLYIYPTMNCNLNCKMCYTQALRKDDNRLELEDYKKIIAFLFQYGIRVIDISGGEPLMYSKLTELLKFIRKEYPILKVHLVTNGTRLIECENGLLDELKQVEKLMISLDSLYANKHNAITKKTDSYDQTLAGIKYVLKNQFKNIGINCVLTTENKDEIVKFLDFCFKNNIRYLNFLKLLYSTKSYNEIENQEYIHIYDEIKKWILEKDVTNKQEKLEIKILIPAKAFQVDIKDIVGKGKKIIGKVEYDPLLGCHAFTKEIVVLSNGMVTGCTALVENKNYYIGRINNLDAETFENRYTEMRNNIITKTKKIKQNECIGCECLSICRGGCPANNYICEKR